MSGEMLTIEELLTLRAKTGERWTWREHEWNCRPLLIVGGRAAPAGVPGPERLPDPELVEQAKRGSLTAEYKARGLAEADACMQSGELDRLRDERLSARTPGCRSRVGGKLNRFHQVDRR